MVKFRKRLVTLGFKPSKTDAAALRCRFVTTVCVKSYLWRLDAAAGAMNQTSISDELGMIPG